MTGHAERLQLTFQTAELGQIHHLCRPFNKPAYLYSYLHTYNNTGRGSDTLAKISYNNCQKILTLDNQSKSLNLISAIDINRIVIITIRGLMWRRHMLNGFFPKLCFSQHCISLDVFSLFTSSYWTTYSALCKSDQVNSNITFNRWYKPLIYQETPLTV